MNSSLSDPLVGAVLDGRYRVVRKLARGGMSTVYIGHDERLDRSVAIKVMNQDLARDPAFTERFTREARAAARLWHPNVVAVHDQGSDQEHDAVFLIMELVRGTTLRDLLRERGQLSPGEALAVIEPLLTGLAVAHHEGLVHRDIKPENILISDAGRVLVVDFGLARAVAESTHTTHSGLGGSVFGTIAYLSPEQVERGFADARSDVYAVGVVLYELLTGVPPYVADNPVSVAYRHVNDDIPPPSELAADVPGEVDDLVIEATNRNPLQRPGDAASMLLDVRAARAALGLTNTDVPVSAVPSALQGVDIEAQHKSDALTTGLQARDESTETSHTEVVGVPSGTTKPHPTAPTPSTHEVEQHRPDGAGEESIPGTPITSRRRRLVASVAVLLVLALVGGATFWWLQYGRWTAVPSFSNASSSQQVSAIAHDAGLEVEFGTAVFSEDVEKNGVIKVDPKAGQRVKRGTNLTIVMSLGPERYVVPADLIGKTESEATEQLATTFKDRVVISTDADYSENVKAGAVSALTPPAGTELKPQETLTLTISKGPKPVPVPDVTNKSPAEASKILTTAKFKVKTYDQQEFSDTVEAGKVARTSPPAAKSEVPGSTVTIVISKGPDLVEVPNVIGNSRGSAIKELEAAGFQVKETVIFYTLGLVADQSPSGGTKAKRGSVVSISLV